MAEGPVVSYRLSLSVLLLEVETVVVGVRTGDWRCFFGRGRMLNWILHGCSSTPLVKPRSINVLKSGENYLIRVRLIIISQVYEINLRG